MGSAADNVGNGSATTSELGRSSLVNDGSNVNDETVLPSAAQDRTGDKTNTESTGPAGGQDTSGSSPNGDDDSNISGIWVLLFWTGIGAFIALSNQTSRTFIFRWWWAILLPTAAVGTVLAIPPIRKRLQKKTYFSSRAFYLWRDTAANRPHRQRYRPASALSVHSSSIGDSRHSVPAARCDVVPLHRGPKSKPPQRFPG
jgi:hypothetical protein